jgi:hypothetical protein
LKAHLENLQKPCWFLHDYKEGNIILENGKTIHGTCPHEAKVKMAGLRDMYECTNCHRFIPIPVPKVADHSDPQYFENGWEDE